MRAVAILLLFGACSDEVDQSDVVLYSRTLGYRHDDAIAAALEVLPDKLRSRGFTVSATEEPADLENLQGSAVVVFLYTTGNNILETEGKRELERFVRADGGWVGIHSAADTEYEWPFYQDLVVAHFASHPEIQAAMVAVNTTHPAMVDVPQRWESSDEWYNFLRDPRTVTGVNVLADLDETTYTGGDMGVSHPIVWTHERFTGRAAYSGMGHVAIRWQNDEYVSHIVGLIEWAATKMDPVN